MPGNDRHGGFASHVTVPARFICPVPDAVLARHELWELAVVSDAVATPYQAVRNSELAADDLAVFAAWAASACTVCRLLPRPERR
jgi:6-hydroxycyclohex-1-ene-1-carbonyl-CoA dehydrogenase